MVEESRQAKTIIEKIKQLLYNYDLTIAYAQGEIAIRNASMDLYKGSKSQYKQRKFLEAKIDKEKFQIFVDDVENARSELLDNVEIILSKYQKKYKDIFMLYFFQEKSYKEIADQTAYSIPMITKVIKRLKNDLLTFYMP